MTYTAENFFGNILESVEKINIFQGGTNYLVVIGIVLISAILISPRKMSNIKVLALPLMVGYAIIGLKIPLMFMVLAGIVFVMEVLTTKGIGDTIEVMRQRISDIAELPERFRERKIGRTEKGITKAKREKAIRTAEETKLIPFRKGTSISDVLEVHEEKKIKGKKNRSLSKKDIDREMQRLKLMKEKLSFWEVDE